MKNMIESTIEFKELTHKEYDRLARHINGCASADEERPVPQKISLDGIRDISEAPRSYKGVRVVIHSNGGNISESVKTLYDRILTED
jgi:hypothetical protein